MKFLLFVMFLGGVWRLYEYNEWMSLKGCRIEADNQALEKRFWKILSARSVRFWLFFKNRLSNPSVYDVQARCRT